MQNTAGYPCGFRVGGSPDEPLDYAFLVHDQGIVDVLDEVGRRFAGLHGGRATTKETVECDRRKATWYVD